MEQKVNKWRELPLGEGPGADALAAEGLQEGLRYRHDGFSPGKRRAFLEALAEIGVISAACRAAGISPTTARRWRALVPDFAHAWDMALAQAAVPINLVAWERATIGAERVVRRNGEVVLTERKPSDAILRVMMLNTAKARDKVPAPADRAANVRKIMDKVNPPGWSVGPKGARVPPGYRLVRIAEEESEPGAVRAMLPPPAPRGEEG